MVTALEVVTLLSSARRTVLLLSAGFATFGGAGSESAFFCACMVEIKQVQEKRISHFFLMMLSLF
jgi:hypothetical protein